VAYIFDSLAINASGQKPSPGIIPLGIDPHYSHKHYWRIPNASPGGILSAVALRAVFSLSTTDDELGMVKVLHNHLILKHVLSGEGRGEDEEGRGGRGGKGRRGTQTRKRAAEEGNSRITRSSDKRARNRG
jgi:hypothetical protein